MERVLEETCRRLPYGGSHEVRKFIACRLLQMASSRHTTLGQLGIIARKALADFDDLPSDEGSAERSRLAGRV